ncbi:DMT family transporter [Croceicoccus ponticola]|uniref:DMT family transporter n=1 Tax=Croceicoccus ponticola TaxID=2217664 RepID=A0A437GWS5_9SPHN|nr:DMT family transporter [Croceicoccus ponticola]RVQ65474.1 DMT family transporter [Croceicoccus ponticola]
MAPSANLQPSGPQQRPLFALMVRLGAAICLATMFMLIKLGDQRGIDLPQMLFIRQFATVPVLLGWLLLCGRITDMRSDRIGSHAARAITGSVGMVLNFLAPILLPLAVATTLGFTAPIFAVVLSYFVLRDHVGPWRWTATALGFAGIVIVADPFAASVPLLGAAVGIGGAFMVALISLQIRDLTRTENSIAIVTWFAIFASPFLFVASLFTSWDLSAVDWTILICLGISGIAAQMLLTTSLRLGSVASVIIMDYSMLLWATFYGWAVFDAWPPFTLWLGAPLVILAGTIIVWRERVLAKENASRTMA